MNNGVSMNDLRKKRILRVLAAVIVATFVLFALADLRLAYWPTRDLVADRISFAEYTQMVAEQYTDKTVGKYFLINLNGLYSRLTGRSICNQVMKLENGMLDNLNPERADVSAPAAGIAELAEFTEAQGAQFLYVQLPTKLDLNGDILQPGEENHSYENADELLCLLTEAGVDTYDLRQDMAQTPEQIEQYFFRTDHHWNFTGAFTGYQKLTEEIMHRFPDGGIDLSYADINNWEAHTLNNWLLGSLGERTGRFFGGTDNVTYYTPLFDTAICTTIEPWPGKTIVREGNFEDSNMYYEYIDERPDWFDGNPYCMYTGGAYPYVQHRSESAPSDIKICLIKDSFAMPVQAFLSTEFKYVDVLDPRYMVDFTVAEHIRDTQPDIVIVMLAPNSVVGYDEYNDMGVSALMQK